MNRHSSSIFWKLMKSPFSFAIFAALLVFAPVANAGVQHFQLTDLSNGEHSFRTLGPEFSVEVPVEPEPGAHLALFNYEMAKDLGIETPTEWEELQRAIVERFAVKVSKKPTGKNFFATYYQDSNEKGEGSAQGDGRALWTGEMVFQLKSGKRIYLDIVAKGIGQTPLAWTNHPDPTHGDGWLTSGEAVSSFVQSEAMRRSGFSTTADLAVLVLNRTKLDSRTGQQTQCAISIRVGNQTRLAHFRYHQDNPKNMRNLLRYTVNRDLGMPIDHPLSGELIETYLDQLAQKLGADAARYFDAHLVMTSPTLGNRTTNGSTIDVASVEFLPSYFADYQYFFRRHQMGDQSKTFHKYLVLVQQYLRKAEIIAEDNPGLTKLLGSSWTSKSDVLQTDPVNLRKRLSAIFNKSYDKTLSSLVFARLGIDATQMASVDHNLIQEIVELYKRMNEDVGNGYLHITGQRVRAKAFEPHEVILNSWKNLETSLNEQRQALIAEKPWVKPVPGQVEQMSTRWFGALRKLKNALGPSIDTAQLQMRAEHFRGVQVMEAGPGFSNGYESYVQRILDEIKKGDFRKAQAASQSEVQSLIEARTRYQAPLSCQEIFARAG